MSFQTEQSFDSTPDLIKKIRQLLVSLEPHIRDAGTFQQAEETLRHLEEYEDNFHKFGFVKQLKKHVDCILGPLIDDEIEKHSSEVQVNSITQQGGQTLVEKITDKIIHSKLHTEFNRRLKTNITEALEQLQKNFNAEFVVSKQNNMDCFLSCNKPDDFSDEEGSYATSFNQGSLVFICHEKLLDLCSSLAKGRDFASRCEAMQVLNQVPIAAEIICGDHWPMMRKHLFDVFSDTDPQLSNLSLKFLSHAFSTVNPQTKEIYSLLVDNLIHQLHTLEENGALLLKNGLSTSPEIVKIIKMFRLMNDFQHEVPNYWVRFPEKFLKKVLESTLKLISNVNWTTSTCQPLLHPVHFVALLDCRASWFSKWMHGIYSRAPLLKLMKKHQNLVNNSVRCVLEYIKKIKDRKDDTISEHFLERVPSEYSHGLHYSSGQLDYALVVHSINLLGRLLMFKSGRKMFPVHMLDMLVAVSVPQLLISLCTLIVSSASSPDGLYYADHLNPASLATEVMNNLCSKEDVCSICLCKDTVTDILMLPITQWLDSYKKNSQPPATNERVLLQVIDILCRMASTSSGRKHLLYGEDKDLLSKSSNSAAHKLAEFSSLCLKGVTSGKYSKWPSRKVISESLYMCRLFYSTCEGLHVLQDYKLHIVIMQAWKKACLESENTATPVPTDTDSDDSCASESGPNWELILQDNLLSVASCVKGVLLLEQLGLLYQCAAYMNSRMSKELQVSKYEKFGYGSMISVFAATATGVQALQSTGFVQYQLIDTWSALECPISDTPPIRPKCWPTEAIDRSCQKQLVRLSTLLYAFPAVYELLAEEELANKETYSFREVPQTLVDFLDRLIILNSPAKIHSLFNYEESHGFGLRVLSGLVCSLDTCLLLETQYQFQELFLEAQADSALTAGDDNSIMIDMLSVERNHILVRSYLIGGPTERILPARVLQQDSENPYPFPLFSKFPIPASYIPQLPKWNHTNQDNNLMKKLSGPKGSSQSSVWLTELRALVSDVLLTQPNQLQGTIVQHLLEEVTSAFLDSSEEAIFPYPATMDPEAALEQGTLSPLQVMGSKMVIRYGETLGLLSENVDYFDGLSQLLKLTSAHLSQQLQTTREKPVDNRPKYLMEHYPGFDWFVATIFLIYNGNKDKAWKLLSKFSRLAVSAFIWPARLHLLARLLPGQKLSSIPLLYTTTAYLVDFILQMELPLVASAFRMSGFSAAQICQQWLLQGFWNYFDWPDIVHYVCVCSVLGLDYQVYLCVAILRYLHTNIALHTQQKDLNIFLKEEALNGFHVGEHLVYMKELQANYRKVILPEMHAIT